MVDDSKLTADADERSDQDAGDDAPTAEELQAARVATFTGLAFALRPAIAPPTSRSR